MSAAELSEQMLEELSKTAARKMARAQTECVRRLAQELYDHRNGYCEPVGAMIDGVWTPDSNQYFPRMASSLTSDLRRDREDGGINFRAKKNCKSWSYCWWLATSYLEDVPNLPGYVTRAAMKCDFGKIRDKFATQAAKDAGRVARALAFKAERQTPEYKAAAKAKKQAETLASLNTRIAGLEDTIKAYKTKLARAQTLLKKAKREHKRALAKRAEGPAL